jgi:NitT/TauT family transport system ATP-binding protein
VLAIRRLEKSFVLRPGGAAVRVLGGIDLEIGKGELFCLLGASGCGKTTLLNILAGFETASAGALLLDGVPITRAGRDRVVFFQNADAALFPWLTAEENVGFGLRIQGLDRARRAPIVERFLKLVGLWDDRQKFPRQLSGGMKQRIQIARALAIDPAILLMDEPFAALDAITRRLMHAELLRIWAATGKTIVFVTHDVSEALVLADRVGVMTRGPAAGLKAVLPIPLPRPRDLGDPRFGETFARVEALLLPEAPSA